MLFKGSAVALVTPFDENNEVNYYELKNLISYQLASGTKAIVVLGTTGEASTISMAEREKIIRFAVCEINHKFRLLLALVQTQPKLQSLLLDKQKNLEQTACLWYRHITTNAMMTAFLSITKQFLDKLNFQ